MDDICAKADVRKGSFYHFFKSKSELEIAALEADWQAKKARYNEIFSPTVPPLERLERISSRLSVSGRAEFQKRLGLRARMCLTAAVGSEVGTQDSGIREKVQENFARLQKYFESAIRDAHAQGVIHAPDAKAKAKLLFAYFQGTMAQARIENNLELLCSLNAGRARIARRAAARSGLGLSRSTNQSHAHLSRLSHRRPVKYKSHNAMKLHHEKDHCSSSDVEVPAGFCRKLADSLGALKDQLTAKYEDALPGPAASRSRG